LNHQEIKLTNTEFRLLAELVRNSGESVSRDKLRQKALGHLDVNDRTIDVHILYLRRKLGAVGAQIETMRGQGYRFNIAG
jgi:two-component system phosphate regulon response regulator PhoB